MDSVPAMSLLAKELFFVERFRNCKITFVCPVVVIIKMLEVTLELHKSSLGFGKDQTITMIIAVPVFVPADHGFPIKMKEFRYFTRDIPRQCGYMASLFQVRSLDHHIRGRVQLLGHL